MTPAKAERLIMLIEECGEVIQAATKTLRHGYDSTHPDGGETNKEYLQRELLDLAVVHWAMISAGDIERQYAVPDDIWTRKLRYTHFQGESNDTGSV